MIPKRSILKKHKKHPMTELITLIRVNVLITPRYINP